MRRSICLVLFFAFAFAGFAQPLNQDDYPIVGKRCPDFLLRNIRYYSKSQATLKDFSGKWLVLDFWNIHCGSCVASFPRVSAMQQEFGDKVQFMLVGIEDREKQIEPMYAKFREKENLVMPCAFDSLLANRWEIMTAPHVIIIDDQGMIRAITSSYHREDMQGFLTGNPPHLKNPFQYDWEKDAHIPFDPQRQFLVNGNGSNDSVFIFRSLLKNFKADEEQEYFPETMMKDAVKGRFQISGAMLYDLYQYAFWGSRQVPDTSYHVGYYPVLEIKDSSLFRYNSYTRFCYSLSLPPSQATQNRMQEIMLRDLQTSFGFKATVEERKFPCWRLVASEASKAKLKTKGKTPMWKENHGSFVIKNYPFDYLLGFIGGVDEWIIDETGIKGNIDIKLDCIDKDFECIRKALHDNGLELVKSEKMMKAIVIKDAAEVK